MAERRDALDGKTHQSTASATGAVFTQAAIGSSVTGTVDFVNSPTQLQVTEAFYDPATLSCTIRGPTEQTVLYHIDRLTVVLT